MDYAPPITITPKILALVGDIAHRVGILSQLDKAQQAPRLRRANTLKTIQGSLAIEGNTLSLEQVTAVVSGKRVMGSVREVREVTNAFNLYEHLADFNPYKLKDLCRAHEIMMAEIMPSAGKFRTSGVGIMKGKDIVHVAPPADNVPTLVNDLLTWLKQAEYPPLLAAALFHYEFEFIHPFADGNGRVGRFWQTLILTRWNPLFCNFPVESMIASHQKEYYHALNASDAQGNGTLFVEFMLNIILQTLNEIEAPATSSTIPLDDRIIAAIQTSAKISRSQLAMQLNISPETIKYHLRKLTRQGVIKHIGSPKGGRWSILVNGNKDFID